MPWPAFVGCGDRRSNAIAGLNKKSLDAPDERFRSEGLAADIVQVGDASISLNVFEPGAHCALGGRKLIGNHRADQRCQAHHRGVVLEGHLHVEMDDGSTLDVSPNDVFEIPPGHDGWVVSEKPMRAINWSGVRTWLPDPQAGERVVVSILISDIVGSTETAIRLGDKAWRELLGQHNREVRDQLDRFRGREVNNTGDGFVAIFDGAARAIRAGIGIRAGARALGLEVRIGVHTGEVEIEGNDIGGVAVHEAARKIGARFAQLGGNPRCGKRAHFVRFSPRPDLPVKEENDEQINSGRAGGCRPGDALHHPGPGARLAHGLFRRVEQQSIPRRHRLAV